MYWNRIISNIVVVDIVFGCQSAIDDNRMLVTEMNADDLFSQLISNA